MKLNEQASASWQANDFTNGIGIAHGSGNASDGLGDAEALYGIDPQTIGGISTSANASPPRFPQANGSPIVRTCHIVIYVHGQNNEFPIQNNGSASWSYSVSVHAQPYDMKLNGYTDSSGTHHDAIEADDVNGTLTLHYFFKSTSGNMSDLTDITTYESLDWSGNPSPPGVYADGSYAPPSPPVATFSDGAHYTYRNPQTVTNPHTLNGLLFDVLGPPSTGIVAPANPVTWTVKQSYLFDDSATGEKAVTIPGPDAVSSVPIVRSVQPSLPPSSYTYTCTTRGSTATMSQ